jgi:flavin reductase (DIM6/NTAB) family NADH-FMN oxidoreductase RutF
VSIHSSHPFATPESDRTPIRRFRGRMPSAVSVWAAADQTTRAGWTLSSFLVADGAPAEVLGILDEDSALADMLLAGRTTFTVNLLGEAHRQLADAFAAVAPAPGGPFTLGRWEDSEWGPVLADAPGWLGARLRAAPDHAGWGLLIRGSVDHVEIADDPSNTAALTYLRGRYATMTAR